MLLNLDILQEWFSLWLLTPQMFWGRCSPWLSHYTCWEGGAHHGFHTSHVVREVLTMAFTHVGRAVLTMAFTLHMLWGRCSPWRSHYTCWEGSAHHGFHTAYVGRAVLTMAFTLHVLKEMLTMAFTLHMFWVRCSHWLSHYTCCEGCAHHGVHTTHVVKEVLTMAFTPQILWWWCLPPDLNCTGSHSSKDCTLYTSHTADTTISACFSNASYHLPQRAKYTSEVCRHSRICCVRWKVVICPKGLNTPANCADTAGSAAWDGKLRYAPKAKHTSEVCRRRIYCMRWKVTIRYALKAKHTSEVCCVRWKVTICPKG